MPEFTSLEDCLPRRKKKKKKSNRPSKCKHMLQERRSGEEEGEGKKKDAPLFIEWL